MRTYFKIFAALSLLTRLELNAQNLQWASGIGGTGAENAFGVTVDASGNVYTTGSFQGTTDFDPGAGVYTVTSAGGDDIFITKLDASGNFVWARTFGGTLQDIGRSIATDANGDIYITGSFNGTVDFDPGPGTSTLTASAGGDAFVLRLSAAGNYSWAAGFTGSGGAGGTGIDVDLAGNVVTTGWHSGTTDFDPGAPVNNLSSAGGDDIFICSLGGGGNFNWAYNFGSAGTDRGAGIKTDLNGNIYTTGRFTGTVDFDPGVSTSTLASAGNSDIFISKLDFLGNYLMGLNMGGTGEDYGNAIFVDNASNIYTTGWFTGTADFDPGAGIFTLSGGSMNTFVSRLDNTGTFLWAGAFTGGLSAGNSVAVDGNGNIYTCGFFSGSSDLDPGPGTYTLASAGGNDIYFSYLDGSGNFISAFRSGSAGSDEAYALNVDAAYRYYLAGHFSSAVDFDPAPAVYTLTSAGGNDVFVSKFCQVPTQPLAISGPTSICSGTTTVYSINNVNGATSYSWSLPAGWSGASSTTSISVNIGGPGGNVSVTANNACGVSPAEILSVTVNPLPNITASTTHTLLCAGETATLTVNGANTYTWAQGGNSPTMQVTPTVTTVYTITGTDWNGCVNSGQYTQSVTVCTGLNAFTGTQTCFKIFPNPGAGRFQVMVPATVNLPLLIRVFNSAGRKIYSGEISEGKTALDLTDIPKGIYFVTFSANSSPPIKLIIN